MIIISYEAYEREAHFSCNDETKLWSGYVLMPTVITKFKRAGFVPSEVRSDGAHLYSGIPFSCISIRADNSQSTTKRVMSEEQRRATGERLSKAREARLNK